MKYKTILGIVFVAALVLTACAPAATAAPTSTIAAPTVAPTEPAATETSVATEPAVTDTAAETATLSVPVTGEATVKVGQTTDFGPILVDGDGMSLYIFMNDTQNSGTSACTDTECKTEWPALVSQGSPVAGDGVDATKLSTITLDDGTIQVTYNGWPLHHFDEDKAPGDTKGQGMDDLWFPVSPAGEAIKP